MSLSSPSAEITAFGTPPRQNRKRLKLAALRSDPWKPTVALTVALTYCLIYCRTYCRNIVLIRVIIWIYSPITRCLVPVEIHPAGELQMYYHVAGVNSDGPWPTRESPCAANPPRNAVEVLRF